MQGLRDRFIQAETCLTFVKEKIKRVEKIDDLQETTQEKLEEIKI